nr:DNA translocase FtsK [uncultured Bacillus sp.]
MKRLFQRLKNDDEIQFDSDEQVETQNFNHASSSRIDHGKNIEARIAYQYPKGKFRFPLIPDEEPTKPKRAFPPLEKKERQQGEPRFGNNVREQPAAKSPSLYDTETKPMHKEKPPERIKRSNRPFKPTDVPSPIYGYKRPESPQQLGRIEYELSSFESNDGTSGLPLNDTAEVKKISESKQLDTEGQAKQISSPMPEDAVLLLPPQGRQSDSVHVPVTNRSSVNRPEKVLQEQPAVYTDIQSDDAESTTALLQREEEDVVFMPKHVEGREQTAESGVLEKDPVPLHQDKEVCSVQGDSPVHEKEEKDDNRKSREKEKTASHLPFNVLMLKQDIRKWEQKNKIVPISPQKEAPDHKSLPLQEPQSKEEENRENYRFPPLNLLSPPLIMEENDEWIEEQRDLLDSTLKNFNVGAQVVNVTQGPSVTRFEVQPEPGVKVNKITNLSDDIKLSLAARDIRIEAPIPGKHTIGIEVPNQRSRPVLLSEIINSPEFIQQVSPLTAALGLDISGKPIVTDLRKMPHGLIAGATGSGKSVCINTILVSLLYKAKPEELKLLLIDPKMVELAPYNQIPHLVSPVITDVKAATASLKWSVDEMERRYELFAHTGVRDIHRFNELAEEHKRYAEKLPYIVIIIDELADLMMMSPADVEEAICRIAQKARACGIHLIIATQRPSVDVITGLIKANIPTRIAFSVSSQVDSRTIIDISGAEKLLGKGDMLFLENGSSKPVRLQGTFVSDQEIDDVVAHARKQGESDYLFEQEELLKKTQVNDEEDELFYEACEFIVDHGGASTSSLQRRFKIGYNRAARLIDMMEEQGFISESRGSKPRDVLITEEDLESLQESSIIN